MSKKTLITWTSSLVLAGVISGVSATTPDPVFWCWNLPLGDAASNDHFIKMITIDTNEKPFVDGAYRELWVPEDAAFVAAYRIDDYDLDTGEIAIFLKDIGNSNGDNLDPPSGYYNRQPALVSHWCDALADTNNPQVDDQGECLYDPNATLEIDAWWITPWFSHGIHSGTDAPNDPPDSETVECDLSTLQWMVGWTENEVAYDGFIDEYANFYDPEQEISTPPDPTRFIFDIEKLPSTMHEAGVEAFLAAMDDDRWGTSSTSGEEVPGHGGDDMYTLWSERPRDVDEPSLVGKDWDDEDNQPFLNWYERILYRALEASFEEALFDPIADEWSSCKASNYRTSVRIDSDYTYKHGGWAAAQDWWDVYWQGYGDMQSPVMYQVTYAHLPIPEWPCSFGSYGVAVYWDTSLAIHRENMTSIIKSLDQGDSPSEIMPWITLIGQKMNIGDYEEGDCDPNPDPPGLDFDDEIGKAKYEITKDDIRRLLTMLRARTVQEFIIWNGTDANTSTNWSAMNDVFEQVWMYDVDSYTVIDGTSSLPPNTTPLHYALEDTLEIDSEYNWPYNEVRMEVTFENLEYPGTFTDDFYVSVEVQVDVASTPTWVPIALSIYDYNSSSWDSVDSQTVHEGAMSNISFTIDGDNGQYISGDEVKIRLWSYSGYSSFTIDYDSVHLVETEVD